MCNILLFSCSISPFFNRKSFALLFFCACISMIYSFFLLGICVLLVLLKLLILNMFCICLWGIYFLWFSLLAPPFPFSPSCFFSYLFVFLLLSVCISIVICLYFYCYLLVFLLLSACVSVVICLYFFDILLLVRRPAYNVYYGRHTVRTTVVIQCVLRPPYTLQKRTLYALLAHNS